MVSRPARRPSRGWSLRTFAGRYRPPISRWPGRAERPRSLVAVPTVTLIEMLCASGPEVAFTTTV